MTAPAHPVGWRYHSILIVVGLIGGFLSGAFGVGGGILMVPLLVGLAGMDQRHAAATSLIAIVPTALAGSVSYLLAGEVDVVAGVFLAVGAVAGSLIGSALLRRISLTWLRWLFVALLVLVAIRMLLVVPVRGEPVGIDVATAFGLIALGVVVGIASGLLGVGGGVIIVPALIAIFGASDLIAKGTSLLVMIPTALIGTWTNHRHKLVHVAGGLTVGVAATVASFGGVAVAFLLPPRLSSVLFAVLLLITAAQLAYRAVRGSRQ